MKYVGYASYTHREDVTCTSKRVRSLADTLIEQILRRTNEVVIMYLNEQTFELSFDLDGAFIDELDFEEEDECGRCCTEFDTGSAENK
jgi:hypothetical protein